MQLSTGQSDLYEAAMEVARAAAAEARDNGASAAILTGSFARGDAHAESDMDLHLIGDGPEYELARNSGLLLSMSWSGVDAVRESFHDPRRAGAAVPAWRSALVLLDPDGVASRLRQDAVTWTWDAIGDAALQAWVAEELTGYAEEVHKLVVALEREHAMTAAIQRSVLALGLAIVMSVHCRMLYETENRLWDMVSAAMGSAWTVAQSRALGLSGEPFLVTCTSALDLYLLATDAVIETFSPRQSDVVIHAQEIAALVPGQR